MKSGYFYPIVTPHYGAFTHKCWAKTKTLFGQTLQLIFPDFSDEQKKGL
jgi:hypothetical protein